MLVNNGTDDPFVEKIKAQFRYMREWHQAYKRLVGDQNEHCQAEFNDEELKVYGGYEANTGPELPQQSQGVQHTDRVK
jgi:hypothetical protein